MGTTQASHILTPEILDSLMETLTEKFPIFEHINLKQIEKHTGLNSVDLTEFLLNLPVAVQTKDFSKLNQTLKKHPELLNKIFQALSSGQFPEYMKTKFLKFSNFEKASDVLKLMSGTFNIKKVMPLITAF
jgi:hypothetical protein